jgi:hypothetical protein
MEDRQRLIPNGQEPGVMQTDSNFHQPVAARTLQQRLFQKRPEYGTKYSDFEVLLRQYDFGIKGFAGV